MIPVDVGVWQIYAGDDAALRLQFSGEVGQWESWRAQWRPVRGSDTVVDLEVDPAGLGEGFVLVRIPGALSGVDGPVRSGVFDVQAQRDRQVRTFAMGKVDWMEDVTR